MPISVVVADDHPIVLDGLVHVFAMEADFTVVARAVDGEAALEAVRRHRPDVLVLDVQMPGKDGVAVLGELKRENLPTRVVLLTAALDAARVLEALRLGARGLVLKEMAPQLLVECVRRVRAGELWLEKRSVGRALEGMLRREAGAREVAGVLTPREIEIVRHVAEGLSTKEIAERLGISPGTVKLHLYHIYSKTGVDSRVALVRYAQENALL